ncbi:MAG TPA: zf-HC2 domain-containing protein, partial [Thermomicrobiales bacterium]|nr:zf-HC2 domain-containing protein [Thermomicrobiales bacterium]
MKSPTDLHNHQHAEELIEDYALGTLPAADAAWMRAHVETCATCQAELALLAPAVDALPFAVPEPPVELSDTVWNRIEQAILHEEAAESTTAPPLQVVPPPPAP